MAQDLWIRLGVMPLAGYLVGSIPFGVILAAAKGVDLRKSGSGNVGATNVARVLGRRWGILCFVLDLLKGLLPALAAGWILTDGWASKPGAGEPSLAAQASWLGVGCGAVLGHVFPFWLRLRGGKGVATSLGVVLGVYPYFTYAGLVAFGTWFVVTMGTRYVSVGSLTATAAFVAFFALLNGGRLTALWPMDILASAIAVLIFVRHRANIRRLLAGTEHKIGAKKTT